MSRTHLTSLTMLLVATVGSLGAAQTPPPKTHADSVAADSAAPKKSRFGGFMNKAKQVAAKAAERAKGAVEELAGAVKNRVGAVIDNEQMQVEGKVKELQGEARQKANK